MILTEKILFPPPPYASSTASVSRSSGPGTTFVDLPSHLLLQVVYSTFPQSDGKFDGEGKLELQRQTLHWLHTSLRLVNRALYIACMHVLRSTYLPAYDSLVRPPYSSDPFPSNSATTHRELRTLDLFIAVLSHEDIMLDSTSLHLTRDEAYKDLFDLIQPRSRLEDLMAQYGKRYGVVYTGDLPPPVPSSSSRSRSIPQEETKRQSSPYNNSPFPSTSSLQSMRSTASSATMVSNTGRNISSTSPAKNSLLNLAVFRRKKAATSVALSSTVTPFPPPPRRADSQQPLPFSSLSISFSPRRVGLVYTPPVPRSTNSSTTTVTGLSYASSSTSQPGGRKRTLVEVPRSRDDSLEMTAKSLVRALRDYLEDEAI